MNNKERIDLKKILGAFAGNGSVSHIPNNEKTVILAKLCNVFGLNPYTMPFRIYRDIKGDEFIYATKECCAQLRHLMAINITSQSVSFEQGMVIVCVNGINKYNRMDVEIGSIHIDSLEGQDKANAVMWATTKAKRRLTLSLSGLGVLADVELHDMKEVVEYNVMEESPKSLEKASSIQVTNALGKIVIPTR